jgi:hypothetical protein
VVNQDDGAAAESRPPTLEDLLKLCRELNARRAKYVVIGGMAMIQAGFVRGTEDIDLLIDASTDNVLAFPGSANAYDSLGEAFLVAGDTTLAIENYRKSLALDPGNANAEEVLKRLR